MFNIAGHLIYWGDATLIFPLSEYNVYATAPNIPTERNNEYAVKFAEKFAEHNLLEVNIILQFICTYECTCIQNNRYNY